MKRNIVLMILIFLAIVLAVQNVSAVSIECATCHQSYYDAVTGAQHRNGDCTGTCHKGGYFGVLHSDNSATPVYLGTVINKSTCNQAACHSASGSRPVVVGHGHDNADCKQCHFANTTQRFGLNSSLFVHDHNFTVEYNYYNYSRSGIPVIGNLGTGKGMFPYYTCTLTCHTSGSKEDEVITWNLSAHARSREGTSDSKNSCAKCKSPTNFNGNASDTTAISEAAWQGIQCRVCHNLHNNTYSNHYISFYNSTLTGTGAPVYEQVANVTELCEKCHSGSSHDSKFAGTHKDTAGFTCVSCHGNKTISGGSVNHSFMVSNNTSGVSGCEICHDIADHTFKFTSLHENEVTCEACHDKTVAKNSSGFVVNVSVGMDAGLYRDPSTNRWSTYKLSHGTPATWPLHNISKSVDCNKCHGALSVFNGTIAPSFGNSTGCGTCHSSYVTAVNSTIHNQSLTIGAPGCTYCHRDYLPVDNHTSGNRSFIVNESNTCRNCHVQNLSGFYERHSSSSDCTQCHFANTTQIFNVTASSYKHDHNLTVENNFYNYNISGLPLTTNGGMGKGMFPYYSCTLACHGSYGEPLKIDEAASSWLNSSHARSLHMSGDNKQSCAKCKSPANYNVSLSSSATIAQADWQGIQCRVCHNLHDRKFPNNTGQSSFPIAFYNSTKSSQNGYATYEQLTNATQLCENCHYGSSHDSKYAGYHRDTLRYDCTNCHMNSTFNNELHLFEVKNTTSGITGCEVCHDSTSVHSGNFSQYFVHKNIVTCEACHDKTVARNSSGYVVNWSSSMAAGLYEDPSTSKWSTYKVSHGAPAMWPLHNISKSVDCNKCHGALSVYNGTIAPELSGETGCAQCHPSYVSAVNSSMHNQTRNSAAPNCTLCHTGYDTLHTGYIVNETNSCRNCHNATSGISPVNESHGNHNYGQNYADCTKCHFANTTQQFSYNSSLSTHDHNLTVEYNYYNYNLYGMPLSTNGGVGKGMFPYYSCTLTCHNGTGGGQPKIENETIAWNQSGHAQGSSHATNYSRYCLKCHSPPMYNESNSANYTTSEVQGIQCRVCHNLHNDTYSGNGTSPNNTAFYNATLSSAAGSPVYDMVANATELCEKCHAQGEHSTNRDIYYSGSHKTSLGFTCLDCHMNSTINNGSEHSFEVKNGTSTGCESCHIATSEHTTSNFREYSSHGNVTCQACHDATFVKNSTDYVVSTTIVSGGIFKNTNNKWATHRGTSTEWDFHNITKNVTCEKCHGGISVRSGAIAPNLTSGGTTYFTTDALFVGYNYIVPWLYPEPTIYANYLINSSLSGVTGVNKTLNWNSTSQDWEGYENIGGLYIGTNFTVVGKTPYFVNSLSAGNKYTFRGIK